VTGQVHRAERAHPQPARSCADGHGGVRRQPRNFGIGIPYGPLPLPGNPRAVVLPPLGSVEVRLNWTPATSGHYCIRVRIESPGYPPVYTYRNLDVARTCGPACRTTCHPGEQPTAAMADIVLVVDNTCPGWTAWVVPPVLPAWRQARCGLRPSRWCRRRTGPWAPSAISTCRDGSATGLIGGIRNWTVPPVHLPEANPPLDGARDRGHP